MMRLGFRGFLFGLVLVLLAACSASPSPSIGQFVDEPVAGLAYSCGTLLNKTSGVTNQLGQFQYFPGQSCTFSVGNVTVGKVDNVPQDGNVTPQDIAGVQRSVVNGPTVDPTVAVVAQFLQSLNDGKVGGVINIPSSVTARLSSANVASTSLVTSSGPITQDALTNLIVTTAGVPLLSASQASANLKTQLSLAGVSTSIGTVTASDSPKLHSITVTSSLTSNALGLSEQLVATGNFTDGTSSVMTNSVAWSSSDSTVVSINSAGLATGLKQGTATITASQGSLWAVYSLIVTPAILVSISVTPDAASIASGLTKQLTATGSYSDGTSKAIANGVTWSSSASSVASVDTTTGLTTGKSTGSATLTASVGSVSGSTTLNVTGAVLQSIAVTAPASSVAAGLNQQLTATGTFSDGSTQTLSTGLTWTSSANYAAVTSAGLVTGIATGNSTITASMSGVSGSFAITTTAAVLQSIAVTPVSPSVAAGLTTPLAVTGTYSDGTQAAIASGISWTSANHTIANVVSTGVATGIAQGTTTLTAGVGTLTASVTLTVVPPVLSSIAVSTTSTSVAKGLTQTMTATATYSNGTSGTLSSGVTWTSSSTTVASVDASGVMTAKTLGSTTVTAAVGSISGATSVNVTAAVLQTITVTAPASAVAAGLTEQLAALGTYSDGTTKDLSTLVQWTSSNSLAGVNASGLVSTTATGTSTIKATDATTSIYGSYPLTIGPAVLESLAVTPTTLTLAAGLGQQITLTGTYSDGSQSNSLSNVTWASSSPSYATVSGTGSVAGVAKGNTTVTATLGSLTASTAMTVTDPIAQSLSISSVLTTLSNGASTALTALVTFSNSVQQAVTSGIQWVVNAITGAGTVTTTANVASFNATAAGTVSVSASYTDWANNIVTSSAPINFTVLQSISGVAAKGVAMSGATITAQCQGASGPVTATSTAATDGSYSITMPVGAYAPCLLTATLTDVTGATQTLYSAVPADVATGTAVANITPITQLVVSNALGAAPSASTSVQNVVAQLTNTTLTTATTLVQSGLAGLNLPANAIAAPLTGSITAALPDSGIPPSPQDGAIDQLMSQLNVSSTPLSSLTQALAPAASASAALSSVQTLATNTNMPTSASSTCPFAVSGVYATANVGASNLHNNGSPNFGVLKLDFSNNTAVNGSGDNFVITQPNSSNPCQFQVASATKNINFQVSRSGFIVATSFAPPGPSAATATLASAGTGSDCFKPGSYCSGFQLAFPVQSGVTVSDIKGTWQSAEWNLDQYTYNNGPNYNGGNNGSNLPCQGAKSSNATCSLYVSFARQFVINVPALSSTGSMQINDCDGLGQTGVDCSTSESLVQPTLVMCSDNGTGDCPTASYVSGANTTTVTLKSVIDVIAGGTVVGRVLAYRAPNNDLIGFFVAGAGGPGNPDVAHNSFGHVQFQEQFGVILRPAGSAIVGAAGSIVNNPQWIMTDWNSGISQATISGTTMSNVTLNSGTNPLTAGQVLYNNSGILGGTTISAVNGSGNSATYTLICGTYTDCRTADKVTGNVTSFSNFMAFSEQVKEDTQVYTLGQLSSNGPVSVNRSFSDTIDNGQIDTVYFDQPYLGMTHRPFVPASGSVPSMNHSISLRGAGWSVSIGTATVAQQTGSTVATNGLGPNSTTITSCTMPGTVLTWNGSSYGCDNSLRNTGKFFTVNLKY